MPKAHLVLREVLRQFNDDVVHLSEMIEKDLDSTFLLLEGAIPLDSDLAGALSRFTSLSKEEWLALPS